MASSGLSRAGSSFQEIGLSLSWANSGLLLVPRRWLRPLRVWLKPFRGWLRPLRQGLDFGLSGVGSGPKEMAQAFQGLTVASQGQGEVSQRLDQAFQGLAQA